MSEHFRVMNTSHGPAIFTIYLPQEGTEGMPRHKRRKALGRSMVHVTVPSQHVVDLVEKTGLTAEQLKGQPELMPLIHGKRPVLQVVTFEEESEKKTLVPEPENPPIAIPPEPPSPFAEMPTSIPEEADKASESDHKKGVKGKKRG